MVNKRTFKPSQLKWLAESLTNEQIKYLLEDNNVQQPQNNQQPQQQNNQQTQVSQPQGNNANQAVNQQVDMNKVKTVCNAVKKGSLNKIEPTQLKKFIQNAGIGLQDISKAIKFAVQAIAKQASTDTKSINPNFVKGISQLLTVLQESKIEIGNSITESLIKRGINVGMLPYDIKDKNEDLIRKAGKAALLESYNNDLNNLAKMANGLNEHYSKILSKEDSKVLKSLNESVLRISNEQNIEKKISNYYKVDKMIKDLVHLTESNHIKCNSFYNYVQKAKDLNQALNENMSAVKYSIAFYKKS